MYINTHTHTFSPHSRSIRTYIQQQLADLIPWQSWRLSKYQAPVVGQSLSFLRENVMKTFSNDWQTDQSQKTVTSCRLHLHWDLPALGQVALVSHQPQNRRPGAEVALQLPEPQLDSAKRLLAQRNTQWGVHPVQTAPEEAWGLRSSPVWWCRRPAAPRGPLGSTEASRCGTSPAQPCPRSQTAASRCSDAPRGSGRHLRGEVCPC